MPAPVHQQSKGPGIIKPPASKAELGKKLLRRILEAGDIPSFFSLIPEQFLDDELKTFKWIKKYHGLYKELPSVANCATNGYLLPDADSPIEYYLQRVHDRSIYNLINTDLAKLAKAMTDQDMGKAVDIMRNTVSGITALKNPNSYTTIDSIAQRVIDDYYMAKNSAGLLGITTGYPTLDEQTSGFVPGDLAVIVARPGMGKTYVLLKMAHAAWVDGKKVAILTMEMINEALVRRWVGVDAALNPDLIRKGQLGHHEEKVLLNTVAGYKDKKNAYFMAGNFQKSVAAVEEMLVQINPDIVYIDASYLLTPADARKGFDSMSSQGKQVINELKQLALRYKTPIVITVQFNRNVRRAAKGAGQKGGSRYDLADIGGTDAVGQDADIVIGLRIPPAPYKNTHRICEVMKIREGVAQDFATQFNFWPMEFEEVPLETITQIADDDDDDDDDGSTDDPFAEKSNKPAYMLS